LETVAAPGGRLQLLLRPCKLDRHWAMLANATRYDIRSSTPDPAVMRAVWILWATNGTLTAIAAGAICLGVITSRKARASPFNLYLVGLIFRDVVVNIFFVLTNLSNLSRGYVSPFQCEFQCFYLVFSVAASYYLNVVIALEVHKLLSKTKQLAEYTPPTWRAVLCQCLGVYALSAFIASWTLWGVLPHRAYLHRGLVCLPAEYSVPSQIFYFLGFVATCAGLPMTAAYYIGYKVARGQLLDFNAQIAALTSKSTASLFREQDAYRQRAQRARLIGIYFTHIFVTLLMWQLGATLLVLDTYSAAPTVAGVTWCTAIPILTAATSLRKPDVREAVLDFVLCRWARRERSVCSVAPHSAEEEQQGAPDVSKNESFVVEHIEE
jgi:hypothetical protein